MKTCKVCGRLLTYEFFRVNKRKKDGYSDVCIKDEKAGEK